MSKTRDEYIKVLRSGEAGWSEITKYVDELEQERTELLELCINMLVFVPVDSLSIYFSDKEVTLIDKLQKESER